MSCGKRTASIFRSHHAKRAKNERIVWVTRDPKNHRSKPLPRAGSPVN